MLRKAHVVWLLLVVCLLVGQSAFAGEVLTAGGKSIRVKQTYRHYIYRTTALNDDWPGEHPVKVDAFCEPGKRYDAIAGDTATKAACEGRVPLLGITMVDLTDQVYRVKANQIDALVQGLNTAYINRQQKWDEAARRLEAEKREAAVVRLRQLIDDHLYVEALRYLEASHNTNERLPGKLRPFLDPTLVGLANQARKEAGHGQLHNAVNLLVAGHASELSRDRTRTLDAATTEILDQLLVARQLSGLRGLQHVLRAAGRKGPWLSIRWAEYACLAQQWVEAEYFAGLLLEDPGFAGPARRVMAEVKLYRGGVAEAIDRTLALVPEDWAASPLPTDFLRRLFKRAADQVRTPGQAEELLEHIAALWERVPKSGQISLRVSERLIRKAQEQAVARQRFESKLRAVNATASEDPVGSLDLYDELLLAPMARGNEWYRTRIHRLALEAALAGLAAASGGEERAARAVTEHVQALAREGKLREPGATASQISALIANLPVGTQRMALQEMAALLAIGSEHEQAVDDSYLSEFRTYSKTLEGDTVRLRHWESAPSELRALPGMRALGRRAYASAAREVLWSQPMLAINRFDESETLGTLSTRDRLGRMLAQRVAVPLEALTWFGSIIR